jgi:2-keto-4-pentenoate hydratase
MDAAMGKTHTVSAAGIVAVFVVGFFAQAAEIHDAAKEGDAEKIKTLLKANPNAVNSTEKDGGTPLHFAAVGGKAQVAALLIANGADVNAESSSGVTPLHSAAYAGHAEIVELLLSKGANVNAKASTGATPLDLAQARGNNEVAESLRKHGALERSDKREDAGVVADAWIKQKIKEGATSNARLIGFQKAKILHLNAIYRCDTKGISEDITLGMNRDDNGNWAILSVKREKAHSSVPLQSDWRKALADVNNGTWEDDIIYVAPTDGLAAKGTNVDTWIEFTPSAEDELKIRALHTWQTRQAQARQQTSQTPEEATSDEQAQNALKDAGLVADAWIKQKLKDGTIRSARLVGFQKGLGSELIAIYRCNGGDISLAMSRDRNGDWGFDNVAQEGAAPFLPLESDWRKVSLGGQTPLSRAIREQQPANSQSSTTGPPERVIGNYATYRDAMRAKEVMEQQEQMKREAAMEQMMQSGTSGTVRSRTYRVVENSQGGYDLIEKP